MSMFDQPQGNIKREDCDCDFFPSVVRLERTSIALIRNQTTWQNQPGPTTSPKASAPSTLPFHRTQSTSTTGTLIRNLTGRLGGSMFAPKSMAFLYVQCQKA
jgi:hypothetical protein